MTTENKFFDRKTKVTLLKALERGYFIQSDIDILYQYFNPDNPLEKIRKALGFEDVIDGRDKAEL